MAPPAETSDLVRCESGGDPRAVVAVCITFGGDIAPTPTPSRFSGEAFPRLRRTPATGGLRGGGVFGGGEEMLVEERVAVDAAAAAGGDGVGGDDTAVVVVAAGVVGACDIGDGACVSGGDPATVVPGCGDAVGAGPGAAGASAAGVSLSDISLFELPSVSPSLRRSRTWGNSGGGCLLLLLLDHFSQSHTVTNKKEEEKQNRSYARGVLVN